jgi:hypothetical protein
MLTLTMMMSRFLVVAWGKPPDCVFVTMILERVQPKSRAKACRRKVIESISVFTHPSKTSGTNVDDR